MSYRGESQSRGSASPTDRAIEIDRDADPGRYRCPRGHTDWALGYGGVVHCWTCEARGVQCNYGTIRDHVRKVTLPADRVRVSGGKRWLSERWRASDA